jgi:drug/metabolite transporter (DMT)-like permease
MSKLNKAGLVYLLIIYIVWGSTYLGIRIAVREGSGFSPFMFGAIRTLLSGIILLSWSVFKHHSLRLTKKDLVFLVISGLLFWVFCNGFVMLGEQRADSGLAALIFAGIPIWTALFVAILDRKLPSIFIIGSLLLGASGIVVLSIPIIMQGMKADVIAVVEILLATLCWSGATVMQSRNRVTLPSTVSSGYQMLFGGIGFSILALIFREPLPHPTFEAWGALVYLVIFGAVLAFTAYINALRLLPIKIVTTYSYVNPVIAVILGWVLLGEKITMWTIGGAGLILLGVSLVFRAHVKE